LALKYLIIPVIGAFIGWITNVLAIRLIFWPYEPVRIPVVNWHLCGVIPKRRGEIAANIGHVVEKELFSVEDFVAFLEKNEIKDKLFSSALEAARNTFTDRLPRFVPGYIKDILANILEDYLKKELPSLLDQLSTEIGDEMRRQIDLGKIIEDRINSFDLRELEDLIVQVSSGELKHIEIMGGFLGFMIGLIQAVLALSF